MSFESGVVSEDWISAVIIPPYKGKGKSTECKKYRSIWTDDVQEGFKVRRGYVDQIFTLKQIGEKVQEKKMVYNKVNREVL